MNANPKPDHAQFQHALSADLDSIDPFVAELVAMEAANQIDKLILVPSVSAAPVAVLQALGSVFQNVCAEGYPAQRMALAEQADLREVAWHMANTRRYADRRFYKGVGYVDMIESLAQRRSAALFASERAAAGDIYANVQSLSGGTANLAIYHALLEPGDTVMGMSLSIGGHLSHGSRVNLSGQYYDFIPYGVAAATQRLDYDRVRDLARKHRPKLIVAGYTSYPWAPDWQLFREIADEVGAYLLADIAHTAGLVAAGAMANPVGLADVTSLTTNKTMCGPRAAVVLTTDKALAAAINRSVFPGLQGAPHPNKFAAVAVAMGIAQTPQFRAMQFQITANARALAQGLEQRGITLAYGGTDTHLLVIDLKPLAETKADLLYGEAAARILELAGLVVNRNTVPGDADSALATGIRAGTPWVTQRGLHEADMDRLAALISRLLHHIEPFTYAGAGRLLPRGKIDWDILREVRAGVDELVAGAIAPGAVVAGGIDTAVGSAARRTEDRPIAAESTANPESLLVSGWRARQFLQQATTANVAALAPGQRCTGLILDGKGQLISRVIVMRELSETAAPDLFHLFLPPAAFQQAFAWLEALSDGYVWFDEDIYRKVQGPVRLQSSTARAELTPIEADFLQRPAAAQADLDLPPSALAKPFFVGQDHFRASAPAATAKRWLDSSQREGPLRQTPLIDEHRKLGARLVPFSGWQMPLRYRKVVEEHRAVRTRAGLFDISHMGIIEVNGPNAVMFLDAVFSNYAAWLGDMRSCYGFILDPDGTVIDDAVVYRLQREKFWLVVNAANETRVWDWLQEVNAGAVIIDHDRPWVAIDGAAGLSNLRLETAGAAAVAILALQGPASLRTLQALMADPGQSSRLVRLERNQMLVCDLGGVDVHVSRTGYTGETIGYEVFVSPQAMASLWSAILRAGAPFGVIPVGLAARDSLRTEARLPLWGHELAGTHSISPIEAGFAAFVKLHKPFFVGRDRLLAHSRLSSRRIVPFTVTNRRSRMAKSGDPLVDGQGRVIGEVTSCVLNGERELVGLALVTFGADQPADGELAFVPTGGRGLSAAANDQSREPLAVPIVLHDPNG